MGPLLPCAGDHIGIANSNLLRKNVGYLSRSSTVLFVDRFPEQPVGRGVTSTGRAEKLSHLYLPFFLNFILSLRQGLTM